MLLYLWSLFSTRKIFNMEVLIYHPKGTCSREMKISYENGKIVDFEVVGGCNGNLKGLSALLKGMDINEVVTRLNGIKCGFKNTSCPDQIAQALKTIK